MKAIVLASDEQRKELLSCPVDTELELIWKEELPGLINDADACIDLLFEYDSERVQRLKDCGARIIIINAVLPTLAETDSSFVRFNGWPTFLRRSVAEVTMLGETGRPDAERIFTALGRSVQWVPDICGMITPRIVAGLINEAFFTLAEGVSTRQEIDTAMKLGTNYPYGPFDWAEQIGVEKVYSLLDRLSGEQARYQPSSLLKQAALA